MLLASLIGGKIAATHLSTGKIVGLSTISSEIVGLFTGTIVVKFWDKDKQKTVTWRKRTKRRKPKTMW